MATILTQLGNEVVIFDECWTEELCIKIPIVGKECVSATACVKLLYDLTDLKLILEVEVLGERARFDVVDGCTPPVGVGIAGVVVCISGLDIPNKTVRITVKLCIGKWGIEKCWEVYSGVIRWGSLVEIAAEGDAPTLLAADADAGDNSYYYVELDTREPRPLAQGEGLPEEGDDN